MDIRKRTLAIALTLAILFIASPALAGGWAVITVDRLPGNVEAGKPFEVGFTVLQHGRTPMGGLDPEISARNPVTHQTFSAVAGPAGKTGHYVAVVTLPSEGYWDWSIEAFTANQPMPQIFVGPPAGSSPQTALNGGPGTMLPWLVGSAGLVLAVVGLIFLLRRGVRWAAAIILVGMLAIGYGFASAASLRPDPEAVSQPTSASQAAVGRDLFLAKGCVTCHAHAAIDRDSPGAIFVDSGPDLTEFTASADYLRLWLSDPASVKPNTEMPNLHLEAGEIENLIAFILDAD
jgi:hypothetical protein